MASWGEFAEAEPAFAARVRALLTERRHLTMATLRRDGSPRISGTEVEFVEGQLRLGSMRAAVKALDLRRDPRLAIHGPTTDPPEGAATDPPEGTPAAWPGEAKVAGRAVEVESSSDAHRFLVDLDEVVVTRLNDAGDRLVIESWHPEHGFRRRERD